MTGNPPFRVGQGYDIHRFAAGRRLVLGGVEIPSDVGLDGHSDADCLCHAIADSILGAASLPDIGHYFPPGDSVELFALVRSEDASCSLDSSVSPDSRRSNWASMSASNFSWTA